MSDSKARLKAMLVLSVLMVLASALYINNNRQANTDRMMGYLGIGLVDAITLGLTAKVWSEHRRRNKNVEILRVIKEPRTPSLPFTQHNLMRFIGASQTCDSGFQECNSGPGHCEGCSKGCNAPEAPTA